MPLGQTRRRHAEGARHFRLAAKLSDQATVLHHAANMLALCQFRKKISAKRAAGHLVAFCHHE
jgi:hypothetical protein